MITQDAVTQINATLPYWTGLPEDVITNTWHLIFEDGVGTPPNITDYGNAFDNLKGFYDAIYGGAYPRGQWVSSTMTLKAYDLQLPTPRVPALTGTRTIAGTASAGSAPCEAAVVLSVRGNYVGGIPQARQRGRVYLGGWAQPFEAGATNSFPQVGSALRTIIVNAAVALKAAMDADNWTWIVLSPTQVAAGLQESFTIEHGFVDNAPDTQRRRGQAATTRTTF